ncbi:MAG: outer membrane beta-barrel protein [Flammeovirgaceae bacterium]
MNSKIKNLIFLVFLISPYYGYTNKLKLGLNGGINFSTITASNATKEFNMGKGFLPGMLLGITSEYELDNDLYLITEINYSSKGYSNNQLAIRVKSYSKYLTVPVKIKIYTQNMLGLEIGPYFSIAMKEYLKNNITKTKVYGSIGNNILSEPPDTLKPFDFGIQTGLSYSLNNINLAGMISFGIFNIRPGGGLGSSIRNLSTQIRVSYNLFNLN